MQIDEIKSIIDYSTIIILGLMGFLSLFFSLERFFAYKKIDVKNFSSKPKIELFLQKNLTFISTIASNAPYVGLLGTVGGIMVTFYTIGQSGDFNTKDIMVGLALALKATALGLIVAIPSMIFYNILVSIAEKKITEWEIEKV
jgi:biopolymer transport protein ExbB